MTAKLEEHAHVEHEDEISPELEALLHTDHQQGLTSSEAEDRLKRFGPNALPENKTNPLLKILSYFRGPIAYLIEASCIVAAIVADWLDFGLVLGLLCINAAIGYYEERKAENALSALQNTLALKARCRRNGQVTEVDVKDLVPGDVIVLRIGDIVPADARLLGYGISGEKSDAELLVDQAALTGESLPISKHEGSTVYSSSTVKQGQQLAVVTKTGVDTFIGRAANLIAVTKDVGHFQKTIDRICSWLVAITVLMVAILFVYKLVILQASLAVTLSFCLVVIVAAIPVGMPTCMNVTMSLGAKELAQYSVIVKRLNAIEELASVSVLCSDKTGTLTLNELTFDEPWLAHGYNQDDLLLHAYLAAEPSTNDPIESAVRRAAESTLQVLKDRPEGTVGIPGYTVSSFQPFNPVTKMTTATIVAAGKTFKVAKGAPPVIIDLIKDEKQREAAIHAVNALARRGLRALGVAKAVDENAPYELVGMISLLDPPRPDSAETIQQCQEMGVQVKMITGDQQIIAREVAERLGMGTDILDAHYLADSTASEEEITEHCIQADGFAQVIPEHKYRVVELLQNKGVITGMTGDGVNDAPALKKADVGIAVSGCTDAARSAADIVLMEPGLNTIINGVKVSRAIFQRLRSYALYRITSTIHFMIFIFIVTLIENWNMPAVLLIMICILNDAATLVISVDNTKISERPDKWRVGQLLTISTVLALLLTGLSFGHYYVARHVFNVSENVLNSIMYLHISSAPHFVIFSTRVPGWCWENMPSWPFTICILGTQVVALLFSVYGVFGESQHVAPCGWIWGVSVLGVSLVYFFFLDVVKVLMVRYWNFEWIAKVFPTPANRRKLAERRRRRTQYVPENMREKEKDAAAFEG